MRTPIFHLARLGVPASVALLSALHAAPAGAQSPASPCPTVVARPEAVDSASTARPAPTSPDTRPNAQPGARPDGQPDARQVDVAIHASASARSITFARQPEIRVTLCGGLDSVRVLERRNLPKPVVAGQTYRDVYIAVEILGRIDAACLVDRLTRQGGAGAPCAGVTIGGIAPARDSTRTPPP